MKIALVSHHTPNFKSMADLTVPRKQAYADKHGYSFFNKTDNFTYHQGRHLSYEKIAYIRELMDQHPEIDWFWYSGCDVLLTNSDIRLEDIIDEDYHFIITKDADSVNGDIFFIRNSPIGRKYMERVGNNEGEVGDPNTFPEDRAAGRWTTEQGWFVEDEGIPEWNAITKYLPQNTMNSYELKWYPGKSGHDRFGQRSQWEPGDFAVHAVLGYLPGKTKEQFYEWKMDILTDFISRNQGFMK